jgi:hypothetical protein
MARKVQRTIRPDLDGRYQSRGLPPGNYVAVAVESIESGGEWDPAFQQQMRAKGKTFHLAEGESATLELQGTAIPATLGSPRASATLCAQSTSSAHNSPLKITQTTPREISRAG